MKTRFLFCLASFLFLATNALAEPLRIGGSKVLSILPLVAEEQGFFTARGVEVEYEEIRVGKLAMDAVINGSVDLGVIVDTNLAFASRSKSPIRAIASVLTQYADGIVIKQELSDLRGARVAYLPATTSHIMLLKHLESSGLGLDDIEPVALQAPSMAPAFRGNLVQAVSIWNPWRHAVIATASSPTKEIVNQPGYYDSQGYIAVRPDIAERKAEAIKRFLHALIDAEEFVLSNPNEIKQRYATWNKLPTHILDDIWPNFKHRVQLGVAARQIVSENIRLLEKHTAISEQKQSTAQLFDQSLLEDISPDRTEQ